ACLPLYRRDRRHGRADRAREAQRRGGEQETRAAVGAQPGGELAPGPELAAGGGGLGEAELVGALVGPALGDVGHRTARDRRGGTASTAKLSAHRVARPLSSIQRSRRASRPSRWQNASSSVARSGLRPRASKAVAWPVWRHTMSPRSTVAPAASQARIRSS